MTCQKLGRVPHVMRVDQTESLVGVPSKCSISVSAYHFMHVYNLRKVIVDFDTQSHIGGWFTCAKTSKEYEVCHVISIL